MKRFIRLFKRIIWPQHTKDPFADLLDISGDLKQLVQRQESMQKLQEKQIVVNRRITEDTIKILHSLQDFHERARIKRRDDEH
jgi:hypothetical protein